MKVVKLNTVKLKAYDLVKLYFMNYSMTAQWRAQYRNAPTPIRERAKGGGAHGRKSGGKRGLPARPKALCARLIVGHLRGDHVRG